MEPETLVVILKPVAQNQHDLKRFTWLDGYHRKITYR